MFDIDKNSKNDKILINSILNKDFPFELYETKHGFQVIYYKPMSLKEVRDEFKLWSKAFPSDYFYSIPLWLRVGAKYNLEGHEISPAPKLVLVNMREGIEILKPLLTLKKVYTTWD